LEDLLKLEEVPHFSDDSYINWSKMQKVAINFHLVRTLQQRSYDFEDIQVEVFGIVPHTLARGDGTYRDVGL
jgi:hypothetical protein